MEWKFESGRPIWAQVCDRVRTDIVNGVYAPLDKLPGVRDLAFEAQVNPNTMQRALAELEREGLLETRGTNGRFVSGDAELIESARTELLEQAARNYITKCAELGADGTKAVQILKGVTESNGQ